MGGLPILFYFVCFFLLTYPALLKFNTHYFTDGWDGLQHIWGIWWVNKALTDLHQLPWHSDYLFYPTGASLFGHALSPLNGLMGTMLLPLTGLLQAHNTIVTLAFTLSGLTAFYLAYYFSRSYAGSLLGGFIFTFSSYHFAHLGGHLNLLSLQWIPLFVISWYALLSRPRVLLALAASLTLLLSTLTDYYYSFYCVLIGLAFLGGFALRHKNPLFFLSGPHLVPFLLFVLTSILTSGAILWALLAANASDPFVGAHASREFSLDLLAPVIHGGHWRFSSFTEPYWTSVGLKYDESSVHLGASVLLLVGYVLVRWRGIRFPARGIWYFTLIAFFILSLGPVLHVWGREVTGAALPYALLEKVVPGLELSGVPARMIVMTILAAAVIASIGFASLFRSNWMGRGVAAILVGLMIFEYLPSNPRNLPEPIWALEMPVPEYVTRLKELPKGGSVLDLTARSDLALYYQTAHDKPLAAAFLSRLPASLFFREGELKALVAQGNLLSLQKRHSVRYLITPTQICPGSSADCASIKLVHQDNSHWLYDLSP
jgi:hypothetical protein